MGGKEGEVELRREEGGGGDREDVEEKDGISFLPLSVFLSFEQFFSSSSFRFLFKENLLTKFEYLPFFAFLASVNVVSFFSATGKNQGC